MSYLAKIFPMLGYGAPKCLYHTTTTILYHTTIPCHTYQGRRCPRRLASPGSTEGTSGHFSLTSNNVWLTLNRIVQLRIRVASMALRFGSKTATLLVRPLIRIIITYSCQQLCLPTFRESSKQTMSSPLQDGGDPPKEESAASAADSGPASRKRKAKEGGPTAEEKTATASLMSLPSSDGAGSREGLDLSTIEGQQHFNPNMTVEEARFQVGDSLLINDMGWFHRTTIGYMPFVYTKSLTSAR